MRKMFLALVLAAVPLTLALAQQDPGTPPGAGLPKGISLYGNSNAPKTIPLKEPKLNLLPTLEFMRQVINPNANAYWATEGALDDTDTSKVVNFPTTDEDWNDQLHRAATLMEAGNGLFTAGRPRNGRCTDTPNSSCDAVWNYYAQELIDGGAAGVAATRAHQVKAAFDAGSQMFDACNNCHARFIPRPVNSRYTAPFPSDEEILRKMKERDDAEKAAKAGGKAAPK